MMEPTRLNHLVLVPGHAIWSGHGDPLEDTFWFLKPFQNSEPKYFVEHVQAGVEEAALSQHSLLVFSGGASDIRAGDRTEALGYRLIAEHFGWWEHSSVAGRTVVEEYAMDSFQNMLFGLCRFYEEVLEWPERITVCGWGFKRQRIATVHAQALRWRRPFDYISVNDPPNLQTVRERELETVRQWRADPFGVANPLQEKRTERDHLKRDLPYAATCPALAELLAWTGPGAYLGPVPW